MLALLVAGCAGDPRERLPTSDATSAAPTSSPPPTGTAPVGPVAWVEDLPVGPPPAIGYAIGHTYHSADGRTVRLPRGFGITSIVPLGEGYLVTSDRAFEGSTGLYRLDRRGRIVLAAGQPGHVPGAATVSGHPVLSGDGETLHWLTFTPPESGLDLPTLLHAGDVATGQVSTVELDLPPFFLTSVIGVVDDQVAIRTGWGGHGDVWTYDGSGLARAPALDGASLISPRTGLVAIRHGKSAQHAAVLDFRTGRLLWRQRHRYPMSFSPSGRHLLVADASRVSVVDARSGDVLHDIEPGYRGAHWSWDVVAWEDERHLLASVDLPNRTAVVRIDVRSGEVELAVDWTPSEGSFQVAFETRP